MLTEVGVVNKIELLKLELNCQDILSLIHSHVSNTSKLVVYYSHLKGGSLAS